MSLIFERIVTDGIAAVSYLIGDDEEGTGAVIDPRPDVEVYLESARKNGVSLKRSSAEPNPLTVTERCAPPPSSLVTLPVSPVERTSY